MTDSEDAMTEEEKLASYARLTVEEYLDLYGTDSTLYMGMEKLEDAVACAEVCRQHRILVPEFLLEEWCERMDEKGLIDILIIGEFKDHELWTEKHGYWMRNSRFWALYDYILKHNPEIQPIAASRRNQRNN